MTHERLSAGAVLDVAAGTGVAAEAALAVVGPGKRMSRPR
jgi:hypothetical protein